MPKQNGWQYADEISRSIMFKNLFIFLFQI